MNVLLFLLLIIITIAVVVIIGLKYFNHNIPRWLFMNK